MDIDNKICQEFSELSCLIRDGYYQEVDEWFNKYKISRKPSLQRKITLRILNTPYFFSFQSFSTNLSFLNEERIKREVSILKNLKIENQLLLFSPTSIEDLSWKHLIAINITKKNKEIICSNNRFSSIITKLFDQEKFDEINKIDEIIGLNVLDMKTKWATFHYSEKNSKGAFHIELESKIFSPKSNIVFAYSKNKEEFLKIKRIDLPSNKDVDILYEELKSGINKSTHLTHFKLIEKVDFSIKEYKTLTLYEQLNDSLKENVSPIKKIKI